MLNDKVGEAIQNVRKAKGLHGIAAKYIASFKGGLRGKFLEVCKLIYKGIEAEGVFEKRIGKEKECCLL